MTQTNADAIARKSSQEVEIDHLLAEEFTCDPAFANRFVDACGLPCAGLQVSTVVAEPSLDGEGFGDLLIGGLADGRQLALLIEDKITAGPATRQAERYAAHAERMRRRGWDQVWTVLVAPAGYVGERDGYDAALDLEKVADLIASPDAARLAYRRGVIARALAKKSLVGVRVADPAMRDFRAAYLDFVLNHDLAAKQALSFPVLRPAYYDGDAWIEPIRSAALPSHVWLRHRLWTSAKAARGSVDLIVSPVTEAERQQIEDGQTGGLVLAPFSAGKGIQLSIPIIEMRQTSGFEPKVAAQALQAMERLIGWYRARPDRSASGNATP